MSCLIGLTFTKKRVTSNHFVKTLYKPKLSTKGKATNVMAALLPSWQSRVMVSLQINCFAYFKCFVFFNFYWMKKTWFNNCVMYLVSS